jgi:hypothetical protein
MPSATEQWKVPAIKWTGLQNELVDETMFLNWYGARGMFASRPNMGIISGRASENIFVIDFDDYKTAAAGEWWRALLAIHNNDFEIETWRQTTGGGGKQRFFRGPAGWAAPTNKTNIGVDIRGQGGFAVLPPSRHISGAYYAWDEGCAPWEMPLADAPDWLCAAVEEVIRKYGRKTESTNDAPTSLQKTQTTTPEREFNDFGMRVDDRDHYMRNLVWASLIELRRESPFMPPSDALQARMREVYQLYESKVATRLVGVSKTEGLEREGRGHTMFAEKWRYALAKWETEIAAEASEPRDENTTSNLVISPAAASAAKRFTFEKVADLRKLPPIQFLVKGWVPMSAIGIFYGKWAAGKSFVGFDLALHLAYEMLDWHGAELPEGGADVLVIAREGHQGFVARVDAFKKKHGITDDTDRLRFMRGSVSFMRDEDFAALCEEIRATGIKFGLVLVDTVARVLPGVDMNEQQTITLFMERLAVIGEITGAASIGVHHQNKSGGMMGSIFFEANADFVFEVTRSGDEGEPLSRGEITCTKMKDGEDRWKRAISYEKVALSILPDGPSSLVVAKIDKPPKAGGDGLPDHATCRRMLSFIREAWDSGKPFSNSKHTERHGRYAPAIIAKQFQIKVSAAEYLVREWLNARPAILEDQLMDKKTKARGLRVVGSLDGFAPF